MIAGVNSDASITACKGRPLTNDAERLATVRGCRWVDAVVEHVPYVMTDAYLHAIISEHRLDAIVHGDDPCIVDGKDVYEAAQVTVSYALIGVTFVLTSFVCVFAAPWQVPYHPAHGRRLHHGHRRPHFGTLPRRAHRQQHQHRIYRGFGKAAASSVELLGHGARLPPLLRPRPPPAPHRTRRLHRRCAHPTSSFQFGLYVSKPSSFLWLQGRGTCFTPATCSRWSGRGPTGTTWWWASTTTPWRPRPSPASRPASCVGSNRPRRGWSCRWCPAVRGGRTQRAGTSRS